MTVKTLKPIQPSAGLRAWYRQKLQGLARRMAVELLATVRQHYDAPIVVPAVADGAALDAISDIELRRQLADWGVRWEQKFDRMAAELARLFATRSRCYFDAAFKRRLRDAGFTVRFMPTPAMVTAYRAIVEENVGLIRSIPREFHGGVQKAVTRAVMAGGELRGLSRIVRQRYGVTYRRAAFIATDQNAKARAALEQARRLELGIHEAEWMHSHAGREPRPEHVRWGRERKRFDVARGLWSEVDKQYVLPGQRPRCRCASRSVIPETMERSNQRVRARRGLDVKATAAALAR